MVFIEEMADCSLIFGLDYNPNNFIKPLMALQIYELAVRVFASYILIISISK